MNPQHAQRSEPTARRAGPGDAPAVADLLIRARRAAADAIPPSVHPDAEVREWVATVVLAEREVWLLDGAGGEPLAVLVLDGGWVDQLYVAPGLTGRGLGSRLIELAKSRRPAGLQLWTFAANTGAQRFYLRHGFAVAEATDGSGNEEKAPDVRFVWTGGSPPDATGGEPRSDR
ncbi:GNAT family N-acetyltransferase [Actinoplanes sp. NPDC049118]|uniref:GNAT family N-acetyltransferase n=1 Tax=Actinoplanes sp. NPDC049118 TaxID=3155769 RepID=UPI00340419DE